MDPSEASFYSQTGSQNPISSAPGPYCNVYIGHFVEPLREGMVVAFVNYSLKMHDEQRPNLVDLFWRQLERIEPESYFADTDDFLTFVSCNRGLFAEVRRSMSDMAT